MQKVTFHQADKSFHALLKVRVNEYFDKQGLSKHANSAMVLKTIFWLTAFWALWAIAIFGNVGPWIAAAAWLGLGFVVACIGMNVGHDSIHGAYSKSKRVNDLLAVTFDVMGASSYTWAVSHNWVHHTYTNVPEVDGDLEPGPLLRFYPQDEQRGFHRYQHFFAWPLYTFVSLLWVFQKDWIQVMRPDPRTGKKPGLMPFLGVVGGKLGHFTLFLIVPLLFAPYPAWAIVAAYVAANMVCGFTLAVVFQLAHVVEGPGFPEPDEKGVIEDDCWAAHQLRTTANFSVGGTLATFIVGGLNHQIEHHLFPKVCHIHYPAIAPIVKQTAAEFDLPYYNNGSFFSAVGSHYRTLKRLGEDGAPERGGTPVPA